MAKPFEEQVKGMEDMLRDMEKHLPKFKNLADTLKQQAMESTPDESKNITIRLKKGWFGKLLFRVPIFRYKTKVTIHFNSEEDAKKYFDSL